MLIPAKTLVGRKGRAGANLMVEITESADFLQSLDSIRARCQLVMDQAKQGKAECFDLDMSKLDAVSDFLVRLIERDYGPFAKETLKSIPPHGRWLHFGAGRVEKLIAMTNGSLPSVLDLFVVAVLLDAGAGEMWSYSDKATGEVLSRSEGLAVAAYHMFMGGIFSSDKQSPLQVDAAGLAALTIDDLARGLQVSESNPVVGLEGRFSLLKRLGQVLADQETAYFAGPVRRPSNLLQFITEGCAADKGIEIDRLWEVVTKGFGAIWPPAGAKLNGRALGDAWTLRIDGRETIVPFHKLSQWLTYSLMRPIQELSPYTFRNTAKMTGLPEYRNGGLFVDLGVLTLKAEAMQEGMARAESAKDAIPMFHVHEQAIVEWRALTVCLLDAIAASLRLRLGATEDDFTLPMVLEAGTWKAGRETSAQLRPSTKNPPIGIVSDGTVF